MPMNVPPVADKSQKLQASRFAPGGDSILEGEETPVITKQRSSSRRSSIADISCVVRPVNRNDDLCASKLWEHQTQYTVYGMALSHAGQRVAVGGAGHTVAVFDLDEHGAEVFSKQVEDTIFGVALSHDGMSIAMAGASKKVNVYHVNSGAELYRATASDRLRAVRAPILLRYILRQFASRAISHKLILPSWQVALSSDAEQVAFGGFNKQFDTAAIHAGASIHTMDMGETAQSVSLDSEGRVLAVGCANGKCYCYDLSRLPVLRWTATHAAKIWIVAVSPNGKCIAAGDYGNVVRVYNYNHGTQLYEKASWTGKGAPFTWGLAWSGDSETLVIGHWDCYAYVIKYDPTDGSWTEKCEIQRGDRVYSVGVNHDGTLVAVGGRDKLASIFRIHTSNVAEQLCSTRRQAFVYAVALTRDGSTLAVGSVDKLVVVCDVERGLSIFCSIELGGIVNSLSFSTDGVFLATGCDDKHASVWRIPHQNRDSGVCVEIADSDAALTLLRSVQVTSVCFSDESFAYAAGTLATVYGRGRRYCSWTDRPAYDVVADLLEHGNPLRIILRDFPQVVNTVNPHTGESLVSLAVRKKPQSLGALFEVDCPLGLLPDLKGETAISVAIKRDAKVPLRTMLYQCAKGNMSTQPLAILPVLRHAGDIAARYPDLFLEFVRMLALQPEEELITPHNTIVVPVRGGAHMKKIDSVHNSKSDAEQHDEYVVRGSAEQMPLGLWSDLIADTEYIVTDKKRTLFSICYGFVKRICEPSSPEHEQDTFVLSRSGRTVTAVHSRRGHIHTAEEAWAGAGSTVDRCLDVPVRTKRVDVSAWRVPLPGIALQSDEKSAGGDKMLSLIKDAALDQGDFQVYSSLLVRVTLDFKWHR